MKKFFVALLVFTLAISMSACSLFAKPYEKPAKEFTYNGNGDTFTVTLTEAFSEIQNPGYTVVYQSKPADVSVACSLQSFSDYPHIESWNIGAFADAHIANPDGGLYGAEYHAATDSNVAYLSHTMHSDEYNTTFKYYTALYKSSVGFWVMQFGTSEELYDTYAPYFETWALSVTFGAAE